MTDPLQDCMVHFCLRISFKTRQPLIWQWFSRKKLFLLLPSCTIPGFSVFLHNKYSIWFYTWPVKNVSLFRVSPCCDTTGSITTSANACTNVTFPPLSYSVPRGCFFLDSESMFFPTYMLPLAPWNSEYSFAESGRPLSSRKLLNKRSCSSLILFL